MFCDHQTCLVMASHVFVIAMSERAIERAIERKLVFIDVIHTRPNPLLPRGFAPDPPIQWRYDHERMITRHVL